MFHDQPISSGGIRDLLPSAEAGKRCRARPENEHLPRETSPKPIAGTYRQALETKAGEAACPSLLPSLLVAPPVPLERVRWATPALSHRSSNFQTWHENNQLNMTCNMSPNAP